MTTERYAPSTAIRERAKLVHPKKPEPTIDDVLWAIDELARANHEFGEAVVKALRRLAQRSRRPRARG